MNDLHDSLVAAAVVDLDPADRRRFRAAIDVRTDYAEMFLLDLDDIHRDAVMEAVQARAVGDPLWRCWRAVAESALLLEQVDQLESAL